MYMVIVIDKGVPVPPSREQLRQQDDDRVLQLIAENPGMTNVEIAEKMGWIRPDRVRVRTTINRLRVRGQLR
jgi:hypothetical protein